MPEQPEEERRIIGELWIDEDAPNVKVERDEEGNFLRAFIMGDPPTGEEPEPLPEGWKEVGYTTEGAHVFVAPVGTPPPSSSAPRCPGRVKGLDSIERQCILGSGHDGRHL